MSKRLLVVDDSMPVWRLIGKTLTCCGWQAVGEEAVEHRPDAVLMDYYMPVMDQP